MVTRNGSGKLVYACEICRAKAPHGPDLKKLARQAGWFAHDGLHLCPKCRKARGV